MARVALTNEDGSLYGAVNTWLTNNFADKDVEGRTALPLTTLPTGTDINTVRTRGHYLVASTSVAQTMTNLPYQDGPGVLEVESTSLGLIFHTYHAYGAGGGIFHRRSSGTSNAPNFPYSPWIKLDTVPAEAPAADPLAGAAFTNSALASAFVAARGGSIGTGGRAAVAFRYDHGLANFRDKILPLHRARGLPLGNAMNPGNLGHVENGGVTWTEIAGWVANDGLQVLAHSYDHGPASTVAEIIAQVDDEHAAYEANLPEHVVEYFAPPGVSGGAPGNWLGWTAANTVEHFTDAYAAAKAVLRRYAVTAGYLDGVYRPQQGSIRQGLSHMTMDGLTTFAECKSVIDAAVEQGAALQIMIHPSLVDTTGYISTAVITEMLDYVADLAAADELAVLSPSGLVLADNSHNRRHDMLHHGDFTDLSKWASTTGWTFANNTASTSTGSPLRRGVSVSDARYTRGRHRELTAKFRAPTGAVVRLEATTNAGGVSIIKDYTLPASESWVELSIPVHMPITATGVTIGVGRVSGGAVDVRDAAILAL